MYTQKSPEKNPVCLLKRALHSSEFFLMYTAKGSKNHAIYIQKNAMYTQKSNQKKFMYAQKSHMYPKKRPINLFLGDTLLLV